MACVPGGKVMANVRGSPSDLLLSTIDLSAVALAETFPVHSAFRVMACPLRLSNQGTIIGFFGDPARPIVDAIGMPINMCVACIVPLLRLSRIAAQLAPLVTVDWMPNFLKKPFSCAITIGEQSVSAMMPKLMLGVSGASLA